jgi:hypothetical protein
MEKRRGRDVGQNYPWAAAGINVTRMLAVIFEVIETNGSTPEYHSTRTYWNHLSENDAFNRLFVCGFVLLDMIYEERRATYLSFPEVLAVTKARLQTYLEISSSIADIEAKLNLGGHHVVDVTKHKFETIGLLMNDFGSVRVDSLGKMYNSAVLVDDGGVYENQAPSPLIEYVHVDDLPGGNYTLNVCNRYTMQVGAGGISMKTFGPVQIGGTIVNVTGEQVNVSSDNEVNIDGGKRLTLTADILILKQRQIQQVMVDSSLGISRNLIVGGGAHIEGELTVNHVTAPVEIQETEDTKVYGVTNDETAKIIGYVQPRANVCTDWGIVWSKTPCGDVAQPDCLYTYPHSHHFRNLPLNLVADNSELRKAGKANNSTDRNSADPQNNSKKGP